MRAARFDTADLASEPGILFVTRKWAPATGGMETYCLRLTEALAGPEPVEVVALPGRADGMPPRPLALLTFPFTVLARCLSRRTAPRVLHLADMAIWPLAFPALFWGKTTVVLSAHGTDVSYHRREGLRGSLYGAYLRLGAKLLGKAKVIANSGATREAAGETGWTNVAVVSLATDLVGPDADGSHDGKVFFAGRLVERKGCGWFIREVLPLLPADISLRVAGTGWDPAECAALSDPRVEFLGPLPAAQLARAYASAACVVVPNIEPGNGEFEGFGLVACEAAACGGLVLAARTGGLTDAVIDGETGILLPSGDADAWVARITEIARWPRERRRNFLVRAQKAAQRHYAWDRVARETRTAYAAPAH